MAGRGSGISVGGGIKIVIDMNLSPQWVHTFTEANIEASHWSSIGEITAPDTEIMSWARTNGHIVFTHDLDFGVSLALTHAHGPSVIQIRTDNVMPDAIGIIILSVLLKYAKELEIGALVTIDERRSRVRLLPLGQ